MYVVECGCRGDDVTCVMVERLHALLFSHMLPVLAVVAAVPRCTTVYYHCFSAEVDGKTFTNLARNRNTAPILLYLLSTVRDFFTTETSSEPDFRLLFTLGMSPVHTQKKIRDSLLHTLNSSIIVLSI